MSNTEDQKGMQVYEVGYLILPSVPEENVPQVVSNLGSIISKAGGKEIASEEPTLETLAYEISKTVGSRKYVVRDAYLGWVKFEMDPSQIPGVKTEIEKIEEMLRFLLIKAPRETKFTFAEARKARAEREEALHPKEEEKVAEIEPVVE